MQTDKPDSLCLTSEELFQKLDIVQLGGELARKLFDQLHTDALKLWQQSPSDRYPDGLWLITKGENTSTFERVAVPGVYKNIEAFVTRMERRHWSRYDNLFDKVIDMTDNVEREAENQLMAAKRFRDDVAVWMRALALMVETVGNAGTHHEKEVRVRAVVEMIESCLQRLRDAEFDFVRRYFSWPDVFKSDYPVHKWVAEAREAKDRVKELEAELAKLKGEALPEGEPEADDLF